MKVVVVFLALFAVALAAPSEVAIAEDKVIVPEKTEDSEKSVEKEESVSPSSETTSEVEKVADKAEAAPVAEVPNPESNPEEKAPVVVVATSVEEGKTEEEKKEEEEKKNTHRENSAVCRASTGATQDQITAVGKKPEDDAPKAVKCYIKCISEAYGVEKDDVVQKDIALRFKPPTITTEEYEKAIENCADLKTDDPCDSAYLRYSCYFRTTGAKIRLH